VRGDPTGERELPEEPAQAVLVAPDVGVDLGVRPLEVGVRDCGGAAVAWAHDVDGVEVATHDRPVHVRIDEVQPGRRPPMAEQAGFDVLRTERLAQQRVVE
jgi:hypothetical protein